MLYTRPLFAAAVRKIRLAYKFALETILHIRLLGGNRTCFRTTAYRFHHRQISICFLCYIMYFPNFVGVFSETYRCHTTALKLGIIQSGSRLYNARGTRSWPVLCYTAENTHSPELQHTQVLWFWLAPFN